MSPTSRPSPPTPQVIPNARIQYHSSGRSQARPVGTIDVIFCSDTIVQQRSEAIPSSNSPDASHLVSSAQGESRRGGPMKRMTTLFLAVVMVTGVGVRSQTDGKGAKQVIVTTIPPGYRDWKFVSAAHEAGSLNDIRV